MLAVGFVVPGSVLCAELTVKEAVQAAESFSPSLKASRQREVQAQNAVAVLKAGYYPTLDAQAVQGYGMPGSNGALGIGGLMGSPFRSGPAAGIVSRWDIINLGTYYGVAAAQSAVQAAQAQTAVVRYQVDAAVLQAYFETARDRADQQAWHEIGERIAAVAEKVHGFVQGGQVLQAQEWLVDYQVKDARMNEEVFARRNRFAIMRLADLTGLDTGSLSCPSVETISEADVAVFDPAGSSPLVAATQSQAKTARAAVDMRKAGNYPRLSILGSAGDMSEAMLVKKQDYSAGVGLTIPLFEGFGIESETKRARAAASEADLNVAAASLDWRLADARFDEEIAAARVQTDYLKEESTLGRKTFDLALQRYFTFQEPLVDVRESIRNLGGIATANNEARGQLLLSITLKAAYDGGTISH